jgi:hypothetical protein
MLLWCYTGQAEKFAGLATDHGGNRTRRGQANFSACPVWMHTQSNITNIIITWVHNTKTHKFLLLKIKRLNCHAFKTETCYVNLHLQEPSIIIEPSENQKSRYLPRNMLHTILATRLSTREQNSMKVATMSRVYYSSHLHKYQNT